MSSSDKTTERDEVLYAFHLAFDPPVASVLADWVERYPEYTDDILSHAEFLFEAAKTGDEKLAASEELLASGRSQVLDEIYKAEARAQLTGEASDKSFVVLLKDAEQTVPSLARQLDIGRGVLTDLVQGRAKPPVRDRVVDALAEALKTTSFAVHSAINLTFAAPQMGMAKASEKPTARQRTLDEIIENDPTMTPERKAFWLKD